MSRPIGIVFDMDGVIVDNHQYHMQAWQTFCKKYSIPLTEEDYRDNINGRTAPAIMRYLFGEDISADLILEYTVEKESLYRELFAPHLALTPGLASYLSQAQANGIPMAVATSAPTENVEFTLDGLSIRHYFAAILDQHHVTHGKPNPEIYTKACAALELPASDCVVFEDAISGIKAGLAAGCTVIGVATSHSKEELTASKKNIYDFNEINIEETIATIRA
ncbi:MAG: HAD family phosphatase [Cyclobacteriaceae bacterium]